jgi:hypothetical protein
MKRLTPLALAVFSFCLLDCVGTSQQPLGSSVLNTVTASGTFSWPDGSPVPPQQLQSFSLWLFGSGETQCNGTSPQFSIISGELQAIVDVDPLTLNSSSGFSLSAPLQNDPQKNGIPGVKSAIGVFPGILSPTCTAPSVAAAWSLDQVDAIYVIAYLPNTAQNCAGYCNGNADSSCVDTCTNSYAGIGMHAQLTGASLAADDATGNVTLTAGNLVFNSD